MMIFIFNKIINYYEMVDFTLVLLLVDSFFANMIYSLASPFLPKVLAEKGIGTVWMGIIFAVYAVAKTFSSIITGKVIGKFGHKIIITVGAIILVVTVASFGFIEDMDDKECIIISSIGLRILQGK